MKSSLYWSALIVSIAVLVSSCSKSDDTKLQVLIIPPHPQITQPPLIQQQRQYPQFQQQQTIKVPL
jgi:hypothetical protein